MQSSWSRWQLVFAGLIGGSCHVPRCGGAALVQHARTATPSVPATHEARPAAPCSIDLDADRDATPEEIFELILPAWRGSAAGLPVRHPAPTNAQPGAEIPFLVEPCLGVPIESHGPPAIGRLDRLPLDHGRELVQFPVGTREGMDEYAVGLLALLQREGHTLRLLDVKEESSNVAELHPYRRARIGNTDVLLQSDSTSPAAEDIERGRFVSVLNLGEGAALHLMGTIWENRASDDTFWTGQFDWQMTSAGIEPFEGGYLVREHWLFVHRKTHRHSQRDVVRRYTLNGGFLVAAPLDDLNAWPETRQEVGLSLPR